MEVEGAGAGDRSVAHLVEAVARAKGADPLAPVTVLTSSGYSAVFVRRALALGTGRGGRRGIANVNSTTLTGLVRSLGVPSLAARGLSPTVQAVDLEALRIEALDAGGWLAQFADHPRALRSLERAMRELRRCPPATLGPVGSQNSEAGALVRLLGAVRRRLHACGFADETDVACAALEAVRDGGRARTDLGAVLVWHLGRCPQQEAAVLRHLGALEIEADGSSGVETEGFCDVVACADPDEEARAATRAVIEATEAGVPLWQQAIFHPARAGYSRVLQEHLGAAGVAASGPGGRRLDRSATARVLLGLLELSGGDWARDQVAAWFTTAPLVCGPGGRPVPASRWDALSAAAGVVRGPEQWHERLAHHGAGQESDAAESAALSEFVADLGRRTSERGRSWSDHASWARGLLDHYVDPLSSVDPWPEEEVAARAQVLGTVESLSDLDHVSAGPDLGSFRSALESLLSRSEIDTSDLGKGGFGDGVFVAPFGSARGLRFDRVIVCGLADAVTPGAVVVDALLGEQTRAADTSGTLRTGAARQADLHDELLCTLRAGVKKRVATYPRSDPRSGRSHLPSRWLDELVLPTARWRPVESFAAGISGPGPAVSSSELELRALDRWASFGGSAGLSPVAQSDSRLTAGFEAITSRSGSEFTRFDGSVGIGAVSPFDPETPVSATRFETYAHCPRRYLFDRALRVSRRVLPEELWRIEPIERGSLVHAILEAYVAERVAGDGRSLDRLLVIARRYLDDAEAGGLVGKRLLWRMDRAAIVRELRRFHSEEGDLSPLSVELAFGGEGTDEAPAVAVTLDDGREVRFRGSADRVDRTRAGRLVVSDYKTGKQTRLATLLRDPVAGGTLLQLPLYGLAARARFGAGAADVVHARYWLLSSERSAPCYHLVVTEEVEERFRDVVGRIASGVEDGCFPGTPGGALYDGRFENCRTCDFDAVCPPQRDRQWGRKLSDPKLRPVMRLVHDEVPESLAGAVVRGFVDPDKDDL